MRSIPQNLSLLERMSEEFETFILSTEIFWPMSYRGKGSFFLPRLTLGGLLLTLEELAAQKCEMTHEQAKRYDRLLRKIEGRREKWRGAVGRKAIQEIKARLNLWREYLHDIEDELEWIENYAQEVRNRAIIDLLMAIIGTSREFQSELQPISDIDRQMQGYFIPGEFVWDDALQPLFPKEKFPYLYVRPRESYPH